MLLIAAVAFVLALFSLSLLLLLPPLAAVDDDAVFIPEEAAPTVCFEPVLISLFMMLRLGYHRCKFRREFRVVYQTATLTATTILGANLGEIANVSLKLMFGKASSEASPILCGVQLHLKTSTRNVITY